MRAGFVSIIGRPNAGKSTLLNALVGEKIAIVSPKPQTTRNRILGMVNLPRKGDRPAGQIVFIDTPGIHRPERPLNRKMMQEVYDALEGRDLLLLIVDATQKFGPGDEFALELVRRVAESKRRREERHAKPRTASETPWLTGVFLLLNKIDLIEKRRLLPMMDRYRQVFAFDEIIPISARKRIGLEELLGAVVRALPEGKPYFPADQITDQPERFLVAEIIREKVLQVTAEEVPYASTVLVEEWKEEPRLIRIAATIYCEREGQKGILIGRGGATLKKIGSSARYEIESLLGSKVFLELFVKVREGWRDSRSFVEELDWRKQLENLAPPKE
jgi:GTP-binding protein Era